MERDGVRIAKQVDLSGVEAFIPVDLFAAQQHEKATTNNATPQILPLLRQHSDAIREEWNDPHYHLNLPREYETANKAIILSPPWMNHTKQERAQHSIQRMLRDSPELAARMNDQRHLERVVEDLIRKAYPKEATPPREIVDAEHNRVIFGTVLQLYNSMGWRKPVLHCALEKILAAEDGDTILVKLTEVCDRGPRCPSAQRQAFNLLVQLACKDPSRELNASASHLNDLATREGALLRVYECFEDYLDDHKERAFHSAFMQPARLYYDILNNHSMRDHVDVHGLNWYLALLHSALGIQLPLRPQLADDCIMGVIDYWQGLKEGAWKVFCDPTNFGKVFEGIREFKDHGKRSSFKRAYVTDGQLPCNYHITPAYNLGKRAMDPSVNNQALRENLAIYLEHYAYFFSTGFLLKKAFEGLYSEVKPEHTGFKKAIETLYQIYRVEGVIDDDEEEAAAADTLVEYLYTDDTYMELNLARVQHFFAWLRICKADVRPSPEKKQAASKSKEGKVESVLMEEELMMIVCPVCMESKDNVEVLHHASYVQGDISSHRMCRDCQRNLRSNECPFCKQQVIDLPRIPTEFIEEFTMELLNSVNVPDANALAAIFELWQIFELTMSTDPEMTKRVVEYMLTKRDMENYFLRAFHRHEDWVRDSAGIFFRFYALQQDQGVVFPVDLEAIIQHIFEPFERNPQHAVRLHPHYYGGFYQQALSAWSTAFHAHAPTNTLALLVRRTGHALKKYVQGPDARKVFREMRERVHQEEATLAKAEVWKEEEDFLYRGLYG